MPRLPARRRSGRWPARGPNRRTSTLRSACKLTEQPNSPYPYRLPPQRYVVGVDARRAAVLSSCTMSSVHGALAALGEPRHERPCSLRHARTPAQPMPCATHLNPRPALPPCVWRSRAGGYQQLLQWRGFHVDLPNTYPQVSLLKACLFYSILVWLASGQVDPPAGTPRLQGFPRIARCGVTSAATHSWLPLDLPLCCPNP